MSPKLIIALDFDNQKEVLNLVDQLDPKACALKIGSELFTLLGAPLVKQLIDKKFKVFLDLKFYDIPNTVAKACKICAEMGVWMINVHAFGGMDMMRAAQRALDEYGADKPLLIAVTVLTSFTEEGFAKTLGIKRSLIDQVTLLATAAKDSGLDGVVCSAHEIKAIKDQCGSSFLTITPGIRLPNNSKDDQSRIMTPKQALQEGSDYLVIGRAITHSTNPFLVITQILNQINPTKAHS